ncbi:MAG: hypothetical protein LC637_10945, partial [Xanthomonadaceae bacterium]|nr:hypothetical protein [Xanthomonadaceae bacterium]
MRKKKSSRSDFHFQMAPIDHEIDAQIEFFVAYHSSACHLATTFLGEFVMPSSGIIDKQTFDQGQRTLLIRQGVR